MGEENVTIDKQTFEQVKQEIKSYGEDTKKSYEELRKSYEELKTLVDQNSDDTVQKERIKKYTEDLVTRQEELDKTIQGMEKSVTERIDGMEVVLKRPGFSSSQEEKDIADLALKHGINCLAVRQSKGENGVTPEMRDHLEENIDISAFKSYRKAFNGWMRKWGGSNQHSPDPESIKALSVGVDPDGGYTVTPQMSSRIIQRLFESDPIRSLASVESITTGAIEWMIDWGEFGCGWEAETETGGKTSESQLKKKRIPVHTLYAKPHATQTLLEDSGVNIENWLANKVADRFLRKEASAFVNGDGVGKPRGFLSYESGTDYGKIEQVNMGSAATLNADGLMKLKFSLKEMFLNRGTWLMNRSTVLALIQLKYGGGEYIWRPGFTEKEPATILGLPYRMSTTMPAVGANALSVALADWKEAYMVVDRLGITMQRDPYTVKPFIEFYTRKRVGGDVVNFDAIKIGKVAV